MPNQVSYKESGGEKAYFVACFSKSSGAGMGEIGAQHFSCEYTRAQIVELLIESSPISLNGYVPHARVSIDCGTFFSSVGCGRAPKRASALPSMHLQMHIGHSASVFRFGGASEFRPPYKQGGQFRFEILCRALYVVYS